MRPVPAVRVFALAPKLYALGARALAELLIDIADATGDPQTVLSRAEAFARLSRAAIIAAGADRMPPTVRIVPFPTLEAEGEP